MPISINSSNTTPVKTSLSKSMTAANIAATKMATGDAFVQAYEDPSSFSIGLKMQSDLDVLQTVLKGIEQSQSMLNIAESGAKSIYDTVIQMKNVLTQAKLGYMTDELIQTTLSPTYIQLKGEINRIADNISFNGQTLINGQSGGKVAGRTSEVSAIPNYYTENRNSTVTLGKLMNSSGTDVKEIKVNAATVTGGTTGVVTFSGASGGVTPTVVGGTVITQANGDVVVEGAQFVFTGITATDGTSGTAKVATGNLTLSNVNLTFKVGEFSYSNGTITSTSAKAPTMSGLSVSDLSFTVTNSSDGITEISGFTPDQSNPIGPLTIASGTENTISNLTAEYALSGGIGSGSSFSFVTGDSLSTDIIQLELGNLRLNDSNGVLGMISTLNTNDNISSTKPTDLTDLQSSLDASTDIPLVEALLNAIIVHIDEIGAYETRLINIGNQLQSNITQVDNAQGVFMNADLADQSENFAIANIQINIAISALKQMNDTMKALQQLAS